MSTDNGPRDGVKWADPPLKRSQRYDWEAIAEKLRSRPGDWLMVFEKDKISVVVGLRAGEIKPLAPDLGFEIRTTNNTTVSPRTCTLYMRWNPNGEVG